MNCPAGSSSKEGESVKDLYREPELEIVRLENVDVIATSDGGQFDDDEVPPLVIG